MVLGCGPSELMGSSIAVWMQRSEQRQVDPSPIRRVEQDCSLRALSGGARKQKTNMKLWGSKVAFLKGRGLSCPTRGRLVLRGSHSLAFPQHSVVI